MAFLCEVCKTWKIVFLLIENEFLSTCFSQRNALKNEFSVVKYHEMKKIIIESNWDNTNNNNFVFRFEFGVGPPVRHTHRHRVISIWIDADGWQTMFCQYQKFYIVRGTYSRRCAASVDTSKPSEKADQRFQPAQRNNNFFFNQLTRFNLNQRPFISLPLFYCWFTFVFGSV